MVGGLGEEVGGVAGRPVGAVQDGLFREKQTWESIGDLEGSVLWKSIIKMEI